MLDGLKNSLGEAIKKILKSSGIDEEGGFGLFPLIRWKIAKLDMVNFGKSWDF